MALPTVACISPFVPPEWIVAHGWRPRRVVPACAAAPAGACPLAAGVVEALRQGGDVDAVVLTTTCDQMRRASEEIAGRPVMLLNVPATWQGPGPRRLYRDELLRLGRFLAERGGRIPSADELRQTIAVFDAARRDLLGRREQLGPRRFAEATEHLAEGDARPWVEPAPLCGPDPVCDPPPEVRSDVHAAACASIRDPHSANRNAIALVGGPLRPVDFAIYDLIQQAGGHVALDATEAGERCLPAAIDAGRLAADPLEALVHAYFDHIPDAFRRPDTLLQAYLGEQFVDRGVRGILLIRFLWCDQWHAQLHRLRQRSRLPVVEVDLGGADVGLQRTRTRIETLVNILEAGDA